jgi:hypothetical protein
VRNRSYRDERLPGNRATALAATIARHPRESVATFAGAAAVMAVFINALFLQHGPHPAPIFGAPRATVAAPAPVTRPPEAPPVRPMNFAPARPAVPEPAARPLPPQNAAAKTAPSKDAVHNDPIAGLIAPSKRLIAVQRVLSEFGYGQIKPNGQFGPETEQAIVKFERDHKMPVTGQMSDRLVKALATMTGRALD